MKTLRRLLLALLVLAVLCPAWTHAAPGDPDPSFGTSGVTVTAIPTTHEAWYAVDLQADGKIVTAGRRNGPDRFAVGRYTSNGVLDSSFGSGGLVYTTVGNGSGDVARAVKVLPDGKILVGGYASTATAYDFALARYTSAGVLDTTFGTGGKVTTDIAPGSYDQVFGMAVGSDGKIVLVGASIISGTFDTSIARYLTDGTLDTTFGTGGKVVLPMGTNHDFGRAAAILPDGKVLVAGYAEFTGNGDDFVLLRLTSNGQLDNTFGTGGVAKVHFGVGHDRAEGLVVQPDGRIILSGLTGQANWDFGLARFLSNGTLDTSFGTGGRVTTNFGSSHDYGHGVNLQADGKIVMVGGATVGSAYDQAVARYLSNGALDTSFGTGGKKTNATGAGNDEGVAVIVASNGGIIVAGEANNNTNTDPNFSLARYIGSPAATPADIALEQPASTTVADGATVSFGSVGTGSSAPLTFTITNPGTVDLNSLVLMKDGANAAEFTVSSLSATTLATGSGTLTFTVTFSPTSTGSKTAAIHLLSNVTGAKNPYDITLTGTALPPPPTVTAISPTSGSTSGGAPVTITGTNFTAGATVSIGGAAAANVNVVNATTITATTPAHAVGLVDVVVATPGGPGTGTGLYTYTPPEIVVHNGSHSLAPELADGQVSVVSFGSTAPNVASLRSFLVRNTGAVDLVIFSVTVPSGYITNGSATTLAPGASYGFQVSLDTATAATYSGNIVINSDDLDEAAFDFPVTGSVVAAGSAPVVNIGSDVSGPGGSGSPILGGPVGSTLYSLTGAPSINSSGVLTSAVQIRHADASLHTGIMAGQPMTLIVTDTMDAPSLPGVTHFNFGPPTINETGHIAFIGEVRGAGITANSNSRCLFSNASDGVLKLVARTGTDIGLGSNLKTIGNFAIGGDLVIFLGTLVDNRSVLFGWDANTGLRSLMRNGQSLDANGSTKTVQSFSVLEANIASSGHGKEISVAPTGESLVSISIAFTDGSSGVVVGSFDGTSDTGFGATYGASQQLADSYASPAVIPLAKWNTFRSPGFDNTGNYYGFISQMVNSVPAGVTSTNNVGVFVDTAPGVLTLQLRENDVATSTGGLVFSDFSDLVLGGGDYEFLVKGELRGSGVVTNVNDKGLWAQHATNGLVLVAREGSEAPGVVGSTFLRLTQIALPGTAQPLFQASMTTGVGGVTTANDTGLWVINEAGEVKLAVREGDVLNVGGTDRTVTAITALLNGTTTGGALGRRVFLADGQLTLLLTFTGGIQANARVVVP